MSNWAQLHVMVNHIPIIGLPLTCLVLAFGLLRNWAEVTRVALVLGLLLGVGTYGVKLSGDEAEEVVEDLAWANRDRIHEHDEMAEKAAIAALVGRALALVTL